jgi:pyruvate dehydrogenase complex dihydrolipoamide acetyltransferase long form
MAIEITIPKLGLTMKEAKLVKWFFSTGQTIAAEQTVALIETDKVSFEIVSPANGIVYPVVPIGTTVLVARIIGYVAKDEAELATLQKEHPVDAGTVVGQPEDDPEDKPNDTSDKTVSTITDTSERKPGERIIASPLARRMAREHDLELAKIPGTGPGGRIVEADILQALAAPPQIELPSDLSAPKDFESDQILTVAEQIPVEGIRKVVSQNMHLSLSTQAQLTLQTDASAKGMQRFREKVNTILGPDETKVSYNAIIIKAVALALRQHPNINASVDGEVITVWNQIHVGVAMDVGNGLIVPKIRKADTKSIRAIATELGQLVDKAKNKTLLLDDLQNGTFTITNLGAWGVDHFTPIVNFPESAILGLGRIVEKPCVKNSKVVVEPRIGLSLTFDHRIIDGAPGAMFLKTLTQMIEEPLLML